jgi:hypothetical protein
MTEKEGDSKMQSGKSQLASSGIKPRPVSNMGARKDAHREVEGLTPDCKRERSTVPESLDRLTGSTSVLSKETAITLSSEIITLDGLRELVRLMKYSQGISSHSKILILHYLKTKEDWLNSGKSKDPDVVSKFITALNLARRLGVQWIVNIKY